MRKPIAIAAAVATAGALAVPALAATRTVKTGDNFFKPGKITLKKNDRLKTSWKGGAPHNIRAVKGPTRPSSGQPQVKDSFSYKFKKKGTWRFICDLHPEMKLTVRVK